MTTTTAAYAVQHDATGTYEFCWDVIDQDGEPVDAARTEEEALDLASAYAADAAAERDGEEAAALASALIDHVGSMDLAALRKLARDLKVA